MVNVIFFAIFISLKFALKVGIFWQRAKGKETGRQGDKETGRRGEGARRRSRFQRLSNFFLLIREIREIGGWGRKGEGANGTPKY